MNKRNRFKQLPALGAVVFTLIALVLTTPVARAQGDGYPHPATNVLPPVGIGFGQTLRVNFLNVGSNPLEIQPCIFDGDGAHLKTGDLIRLRPGQMRSFDLSRSEIGGRTENSVEVRAGVHADRPELRHLVVAGELIEDATGESSLYMPGKRSRPEAERAGRLTSTLAPVGIVAGQTARVTFLNVGSSPVEIEPCWFDSNGAHLKEGATMMLAPGQMRSLELNWSEAVGGRTETRVQVRGAVHVRRRDARHLVIAGEVIDDATGRSSLYVSPGTRRGFDPQPDPPR
ncbi:MAG: hypothetical protein ND895_14670 [Pyrinomonadaceae bacterium]|nr:hypothetical protein [Pyrinomonadaceae bacterium]